MTTAWARLTRGLALAVLSVAGCRQAPAPRPMTIRFFLESERPAAPVVVLPVSRVEIAIEPKPVLSEYDFTDVTVAGEELGACLRFQLDAAAAHDLYRLTTVRSGRRLVLLVDGEPLGARRIDGLWEAGRVQIFVERPDDRLGALASELREAARERRRGAQKK